MHFDHLFFYSAMKHWLMSQPIGGEGGMSEEQRIDLEFRELKHYLGI